MLITPYYACRVYLEQSKPCVRSRVYIRVFIRHAVVEARWTSTVHVKRMASILYHRSEFREDFYFLTFASARLFIKLSKKVKLFFFNGRFQFVLVLISQRTPHLRRQSEGNTVLFYFIFFFAPARPFVLSTEGGREHKK